MKKSNKGVWYKKVVELIKKLSPPPHAILIFTLIALIIYPIILITIWTSNLKFSLYFVGIDWNIFVFYLRIYGMLILVLYALTKWYRVKAKNTKIGQLVDHFNGYFWFSVFLAFLISSFGISVVSNIYSPSLPQKLDIISLIPPFNENVKEVSKLKCDNEYHEFVVGHDMTCELNITYYDNTKILLKEMRIKDKSEDQDFKDLKKFEPEFNNKITLEIPITKEGINKYTLYYNFYDTKESSNHWHSKDFYFDAVSYKDYQSNNSKLFTYLFSIITVALFSVVIFVNNLRGIMEPPRGR